MDKNNNAFPQQDAPQKNTDNAFVQVGEDGKPQMPEKEVASTPTTQQPGSTHKNDGKDEA